MSPQPPDYIPEADGRDIFAMSPCWYCEHLLTNGQQYNPTGWTCKAFPRQIPAAIFSRQFKHDHVVDGQEGDFVYISKEIDNGSWGYQTRTWEGEWEDVIE